MRSMRKRRAAVALAGGVIVALVAACSSGGGGSSGSKVTKLSFWFGQGGSNGKEVQLLVSNFNKSHPNINVTATFQGKYSGGGAEQQKILAAIAAGNPPDIAQLEVNSLPAFAQALRPVTDLMNASSDTRPQDFIPGILSSTKFNGQYLAVPFNRSIPVLMYNKTLFQKAGITKPPATWEELKADATKLHTSTVSGFDPAPDWWLWEAAILSGGGKILSADLKKAEFTTPQALYVPKLKQAMLKSGVAHSHSGTNGWQDNRKDFYNGHVGMTEETNASLGAAAKAIGNKFEWGVAPFPHAQGQQLSLPPGGGNLAMFKKTPKDKVQAAWTFMSYMCSAKVTAEWSQATGYVAVKKAAYDEPDYKAFLTAHPQFAVAKTTLDAEFQPPQTQHYYAILEYGKEAQTQAWFEGTPVEQTFEQAAKKTDQLLQ